VAGQKIPALGQGLGMRVDQTDFTVIHGFNRQQAMAHLHFGFADSLQVGGCEQIVDLGDRPFQGVFHRHHPQVEMAFFKSAKDIDKFQAGNAGPVRNQPTGSHITVCPMLPLEGNQGFIKNKKTASGNRLDASKVKKEAPTGKTTFCNSRTDHFLFP